MEYSVVVKFKTHKDAKAVFDYFQTAKYHMHHDIFVGGTKVHVSMV